MNNLGLLIVLASTAMVAGYPTTPTHNNKTCTSPDSSVEFDCGLDGLFLINDNLKPSTFCANFSKCSITNDGNRNILVVQCRFKDIYDVVCVDDISMPLQRTVSYLSYSDATVATADSHIRREPTSNPTIIDDQVDNTGITAGILSTAFTLILSSILIVTVILMLKYRKRCCRNGTENTTDDDTQPDHSDDDTQPDHSDEEQEESTSLLRAQSWNYSKSNSTKEVEDVKRLNSSPY